MLSLLVRAIGRLPVGRKLMLIYLLDLSAVIYVSSILINEKYIAIDFSRKEVAGNAYIAAVRDALVMLPTPLQMVAVAGWALSCEQHLRPHRARPRQRSIRTRRRGRPDSSPDLAAEPPHLRDPCQRLRSARALTRGRQGLCNAARID
jgi:hypothetical protein